MSQTKIGWRPYVNPISSLLTSIYGAWNGDTTSTVTTLNSSVYAAWNGENTLNDSFGTKNGTAVGSVTYSTGKVGSNSFNLNGSSYVQLPMSTLNITGDFTVNMWVKVNSTTTTNQGLIGNWRAGYNTGWSILFNNGWLQAFGGNRTNGASGFFVEATSGNISGFLNTWRMVTFVYKSGVSSYFYVDSTKGGVNNNTHTIPPTTVSNGRIGSEPQNNYHLNGNIDAVTIWNRALSDTEVSALYNQSNGLQYSFPSSISVDLPSPNDSVSTNHGTLVNGTTFTDGKIGKAFTFDGVNDYVSLPDNSLNLTGDFTISVWVYPTAGTPQSILSNIAYASGTVYKGWQLDINNVSGAWPYKVTFTTGQGPANNAYTGWEYRTTSLTQNAWNHILIKRVGGVNTYCWVNNISQSYTLFGIGANITTNPTYHTTQYNTIGSSKQLSGTVSNYLANGSKVDGVTVWNRALTDDERTQIYNSGNGKQYPNY